MKDNPNITKKPAPFPYLTLSQAAKILPCKNGRRIHPSTLWRWTRGLRGVCLQYVRIGRLILVTEDGLERFFTELAKQDQQRADLCRPRRRRHRPRRTIGAARQRSIEAANQVLFRAGILPSENRQTVSASGRIG